MTKKYTNEEVAEKVELEDGLGYVVQHYFDPDSLEDPKLAKLFHQAKDLLDKIAVFLEPYYV